MKVILITGSQGFIAKNLKETLGYNLKFKIITFERGGDLKSKLLEADFIFHLAGVNRSVDTSEFKDGNVNLTKSMVDFLILNNRKTPIVFASSTQIELDNEYGKSKKEAEDILNNYLNKTGAKVFIFRLPNVFGKWSKPNYNSVVATFCYNVSRSLPIKIKDELIIINLLYIDDLINQFLCVLNEFSESGIIQISNVYKIQLGEIASIISSFKDMRLNCTLPDMSSSIVSKLYSTYLSFLPSDQFKYPLKMNIDARGSFTEFLKSNEFGQISVNISKPDIVKGNHWHHSKNEKFLVVSGQAEINFRKVDTTDVVKYLVSSEVLEVVEIPTGYAHNIINLGKSDLVTLMWSSEQFSPEKPDTFTLKV